MRLLTDENIARSVTRGLIAEGYDVLDVKQQEWHGRSDEELIATAEKEKRIIVTHDTDFLDQNRIGVVLVRLHRQHPARVLERLIEVLRDTHYQSQLVHRATIIVKERTTTTHDTSSI
jgi:predicted nuclease of predicted toxin-antitoxin system